MTPLDFIKSKCVEAYGGVSGKGAKGLSLTDVLLAMDENSVPAFVTANGKFAVESGVGADLDGYSHWNLDQTLDDQSEECKLFIARTLGWEGEV